MKKFLDENGLLYLWGKINAKFAQKTELEPNKIETIKVNGVVSPITDKQVDIKVPTSNSELLNGEGYQTWEQVTQAISEAISGITDFDYEIVETLPTTGQKGTIYFLKFDENDETNKYQEYLFINGKWEKIGKTDVDLTGYLKDTDLVPISNIEIDEMFATL